MKKTIIIIVTVVCAISICALSIAAIKTAEPITNSCYALTTKVVEVDEENDIVICEDFNGNLWQFYGVEDWEVGDCASLLMNSKGTEKIFDDEIMAARFSAWTLTR